MAKAPLAGQAKTRLIPALGADGAARLAARLLAHAVQQARVAVASLQRYHDAELILACAPDTSHPAFAAEAARGGIRLATQGDGGLGARMQRAFEQAFSAVFCGRATGRVVLLGTDAPSLDAARLLEACAALGNDTDAVVVPAHDGGYALIGLTRPQPALFDDAAMPWSTPRVMALTRERLARAGLCHVELAPVYDIDTPADLARLDPGWL